ncbi:hypothetical protein CLPUN_50320 [Clostridium puniceum]|uniref:DUF2249 domain-containing protein n=1 Tax=Clostridium puniceum TaxID=29367 RepID=A0A1S8SZT2_9CLOT|nr:DUF2249 domain-containing protein [Clostridium puniceum]OOM71040.1 hypothetical protein CLPUN_50320 [Clostridium puniceum]
MTNFDITIDVRIYEKGHKKDIIFKAFEELAIGEIMELINDHDPRPLYQQFILNFPEHFKWEYLEQGPEIWRIAITKK